MQLSTSPPVLSLPHSKSSLLTIEHVYTDNNQIETGTVKDGGIQNLPRF